MNFYFAPMEGITGYIYRNAHHTCFPGIDRYFTPFITANEKKNFSNRERNDILPEHNEGIPVVPQILTNRAQDFIWAASELKKYGYGEVNLNLGCPSGTVVSKYKGSGFLSKQEELNEFLDEIFSSLDMKISVKTRIGRFDPEEFYELIHIFNRYPLSQLIIHPRIQTDYYKNKPNMEVFKNTYLLSNAPVCYNGDLTGRDSYEAFRSAFPDVETVMLGRGLVADPGLAGELAGGEGTDKARLKEFHDLLCRQYREAMGEDRNTLFKMKELWFYMGPLFTEPDRYLKKIRKAGRLSEYEAVVSSLFREQDLKKMEI